MYSLLKFISCILILNPNHYYCHRLQRQAIDLAPDEEELTPNEEELTPNEEELTPNEEELTSDVEELTPSEETTCGKLCDSGLIDAIAPLSVESDANYFVLIVRGLCSWILDLKDPTKVSDTVGRKHHFKFPRVESLFTIFDDPNKSDKYNMTALFTSGMVGEVWRTENGVENKAWSGSLPLRGLGHSMQRRIDATIGWQPNDTLRIAKVFQNDSYYTYDLKANSKLAGPDSLEEDFSFDIQSLGQISAAFSRAKSIYFFTENDSYVWNSVNKLLGPKESVLGDFYKCGSDSVTVPAETDRPADEEPIEGLVDLSPKVIDTTEGNGVIDANEVVPVDVQTGPDVNPGAKPYKGSDAKSKKPKKGKKGKSGKNRDFLSTKLLISVISVIILKIINI